MEKTTLPPVSETEIAFTRMLSAGNYAAAVNILLLSGFAVQFYNALDAKNLDKVMNNLHMVIVQITQRYAPNQPLQCEPNSAAQQVEYLTEQVMRLIEKNCKLKTQIITLQLHRGQPWWQRIFSTQK